MASFFLINGSAIADSLPTYAASSAKQTAAPKSGFFLGATLGYTMNSPEMFDTTSVNPNLPSVKTLDVTGHLNGLTSRAILDYAFYKGKLLLAPELSLSFYGLNNKQNGTFSGHGSYESVFKKNHPLLHWLYEQATKLLLKLMVM